MLSTRATDAALPSKKRKSSHDSAVAATAGIASVAPLASSAPRKGSEAGSSQASDVTCSVSFHSAMQDGTSSIAGPSITIKTTTRVSTTGTTNVPPKKRKASLDILSSTASTSDGPLRKRKLSDARLRLPSVGSLDDLAFGLGSLGAISHESGGVDHVPMSLRASDDGDTVGTHQLPITCDGALAHLEALEDETSISKFKSDPSIRDDEGSQTSFSHNRMPQGDQKLLVEALMGNSFRRDRLESWGGMSDISLAMGSIGYPQSIGEGTAAAAAIAASALQRPFLEDESDESIVSVACKPIPSKISLGRDRLYSITSLGEPSVSGYEIDPKLQRFVAEAMANVGDQLAELAGAVEIVAGCSNSIASDLWKDDHSDCISTASSLPEVQAELRRHKLEDGKAGRPRSMSTSSNAISIDYEAVAAAVDAGEAATGALGLASFGGTGRPKVEETHSNQLPPIMSQSTKTERDMEEMRARARAAAGYVPPETLKAGELPPAPTKKRLKSTTPQHKPVLNKAKHYACVPEQTYSMYNSASKASSQKWDEMFDCLVQFVAEQKVDTRGMTEKERKEAEWDGNVPTTYKTKDGKALGRWINNQRSAKHKGVLKKDREKKLMSTGLKWSVLSTNSWHDMMEELQLYVAEKTKDGSEWDGNVPTNYKIKGSCLDENGEERNLGRWINRQRSLYQSGKLRKDRETELEALGLKWSVLSTTSWQSMYDTLVEYVDERKISDGEWDGNVPANYKTTDVPPKALGRWINRQRTAHQKHKLKSEFVEKLNSLGLKWSVHERRSIVPMSQLATPIKSNMTVVSAPTTVPNQPPGPIAAAARIAASKGGVACPDVVKSHGAITTAVERSRVGNSSEVSEHAKMTNVHTVKLIPQKDDGSSPSTAVHLTTICEVPTMTLSKQVDGNELSDASAAIQMKTVSVQSLENQTRRDLNASDNVLQKRSCADDEKGSKPILPIKTVGSVQVGE